MYDRLTESDIKKMQEEIDYPQTGGASQRAGSGKRGPGPREISAKILSTRLPNRIRTATTAEIRYLEKMIKTAHVISDESKDDEVGINNTVTVYVEDDDEEEVYKLVTAVRGNSLKGYVTIDSPAGEGDFPPESRRPGDRSGQRQLQL